MVSASLPTRPSPSPTAAFSPTPTPGRARPPPRLRSHATATGRLGALSIKATHSGGLSDVSVQSLPENERPVTGAAYSFTGATTSLTNNILTSSKKITLVRHGLSSWNAQSRVQSTAEIIWQGKEEPLVFLDSLKEAHLFFLEGMSNADAKKQYPELYTKWREDPANFHVHGIYPIRELWGTARQAWEQILLTPGENFLVVTHKSILRALICTALGLPPERFRAIDVNNGGMCVFTVNKQGEAMLQALNMTAHMYSDHTYEY
ncbi:unnamed protein product [Urochloa decumbens]|uniref:2-carboxy-D-arabinitol-1-phosphatase n=1 Tax=Urochloa decumbens TaxID=240449 RepID=A0ABC9AJB6_9POAL